LSGFTHAVAPTGERTIFAKSEGAIIKVWDLKQSNELAILSGHTHTITALAMTEDEKYIISTSEDHTLKVWDLKKKKNIASFSGDGPLLDCAITKDGRTIIAGSAWDQTHILRLEGEI
jgi:WD40 repeat protein